MRGLEKNRMGRGQTRTQTDRQTDIATTRKNRPKGRFFENQPRLSLCSVPSQAVPRQLKINYFLTQLIVRLGSSQYEWVKGRKIVVKGSYLLSLMKTAPNPLGVVNKLELTTF